MDEDTKNALVGMMETSFDIWKQVDNEPDVDAAHTQAYANCVIALQLTRIADALERLAAR